MMSPYLAYFLGIITILVPLLMFYVFSLNFTAIDDSWQKVFCNINVA